MLPSALLTALMLTAPVTAPTSPAPGALSAPVQASASAQAFVRIIQAAEVRGGRSDAPHQRTVRRDALGATQILLQFE